MDSVTSTIPKEPLPGMSTHTREVTVTGASFEAFSVLGEITASGKCELYDKDAATGIETPKYILAEAVDASVSDQVAIVYDKGLFDEDQLVFKTGSAIANARDALRQRGIYAEKRITRAGISN